MFRATNLQPGNRLMWTNTGPCLIHQDRRGGFNKEMKKQWLDYVILNIIRLSSCNPLHPFRTPPPPLSPPAPHPHLPLSLFTDHHYNLIKIALHMTDDDCRRTMESCAESAERVQNKSDCFVLMFSFMLLYYNKRKKVLNVSLPTCWSGR